jgi:predicted chitinase
MLSTTAAGPRPIGFDAFFEAPRPTRFDHSADPLQRGAASTTSRPSSPRSAGDTIANAAVGRPDTHRRAALVSALLACVPGADRPAARTAIPAILDAARRSGSTDPNRIAYLLATAQTESDFGANMTETGHSPAWFNRAYGCADGNRPGTDDGFVFRGRGYVQTTRAGRYAELSHHLGLPDVLAVENGTQRMVPALVAHPEQLTQPRLAAQALVIGVEKNLFTHNRAAALDATIPTGRKPGAVDFYHARGIVNGIVRDQAQAIARHATVFAQILDGYRHSVLGAPRTK